LGCCGLQGVSNDISYEIAVSDITCPRCVARVKGSISSSTGALIYDFKADYRAKTGVFYVLSRREISWDDVEKALIEASKGTPHNYRILYIKRLNL